jgi:hypothetical protein
MYIDDDWCFGLLALNQLSILLALLLVFSTMLRTLWFGNYKIMAIKSNLIVL